MSCCCKKQKRYHSIHLQHNFGSKSGSTNLTQTKNQLATEDEEQEKDNPTPESPNIDEAGNGNPKSETDSQTNENPVLPEHDEPHPPNQPQHQQQQQDAVNPTSPETNNDSTNPTPTATVKTNKKVKRAKKKPSLPSQPPPSYSAATAQRGTSQSLVTHPRGSSPWGGNAGGAGAAVVFHGQMVETADGRQFMAVHASGVEMHNGQAVRYNVQVVGQVDGGNPHRRSTTPIQHYPHPHAQSHHHHQQPTERIRKGSNKGSMKRIQY